MIWSHKARMHWVCNDINGVFIEVKLIEKTPCFNVVNAETGEIILHGETSNVLDAMKLSYHGYQMLFKKVNSESSI